MHDSSRGPSHDSSRGPSRGLAWLRAAAILHIVVLVAIRLVTDADDFNNWDLISLVNANAFGSLAEVLAQPEVHFTNPFRFPGYNTGAESVISVLVHRAMSGVSLYWSNTVVLVLYDLMVLAALAALFRLVFRDSAGRTAAWLLAGMSTALLTFLSLSAFNVQAYATILLALTGCELVLQGRTRRGTAAIAFAFLCISQAYPLTFFLPHFCLVWTAARASMAAARAGVIEAPLVRNVRAVVVAVAVCVLIVEAGSLGSSSYLGKMLWVVADPLEKQTLEPAAALSSRVAWFFREAFWPAGTEKSPWPGFAPYFLWAALAMVGLAAVFVRGGEPRACPVPLPPGARALPGWLMPLLPMVPAAAWGGLVLFGYLPSMFGTSLKSQRCVFGDLFLVMATASAAGWLMRRLARRGAVLAVLVVLLAASDVMYVQAFLGQDHTEPHRPIFDYDIADGAARHDADATLDVMREQLDADDEPGLLVYYRRGHAENSTDPTMFYARFLRRIGPWQRAHWVFPCRICDTRYGCAFPDVVGRGCRRKCCYFDAVKTVLETPALRGRRLLVWWFEDAEVSDLPRRRRVLDQLQHHYRSKDLGTPAPERRWRVFELTPRELRPAP